MSDDELEAFLDIAAYGTMDRQMATEELTRKLRSISKHLEPDARFLGGCVANAICIYRGAQSASPPFAAS